jgi:DNA-binding transcriptional LysR family regulator
MLSLTQLEVFVRVVEEGGFSGAAKSLYMSQPAVSNHIRNLEKALGVGLVIRGPQGARATAAGSVVADHAREIFAMMRRLELAAANYKGLEAGSLTVAATTTPAKYLLPQLITSFAARAPKVTCEIRSGNEDTVESWILRGDVSLGICVGTRPPEPLVAEPLFDEQMLLVARPAHPLVGTVVQPEDLREERFLLREAGSATRRLQEQAIADWGVAGVGTWDLWGADTLKEGVQQGLGIAVLPDHATRREIDAGQLSKLDVRPAPPTRTVSLVRRADRLLTPPEEAFAALVRSTTEWPVFA